MQSNNTAKQIARLIALGALFLIPLAPLIVANPFFFPFITGKAFFFRILVEVAVCAWVVLALLDREYRPRFSWIGVAVVAFVGWMFIADIFALNAAKAFWSNFERMEGWVLLIHLLGFFFASSCVLRVEKKWRAWFLTSLGVSVIVSCYALLQLAGSADIHQGSRVDASFGNSAYLAIYFLFNTFIALWLALTEKYSWLKWSLLALAVLEGALLVFTETRGAVLGLVFGLALAALLTAFTAGKRVRQYAALALVLILVLVSGFYLARNSSFVQGNHVLQRVASISLADGSTRFTIWNMALKGVQERPLIGWGQEGFNYVFNKYYDPSLYQQEPWFDRAHNAFIDWLTAGGVPAFLFYVSLFATAIVMLWRRSELSRPERIALTAALAGYAIHNLFVFDNLYSYIYLFAILALIDSQVGRPVKQLEAAPAISDDAGMTYALPVAAAAALMLVLTVNVPGMQASSNLIVALSQSSSGIDGNIAAFEDIAAHPSFATQEVREQIVSFAGSVVQGSAATDEQKQRAITLAITEMQKQVAAYPFDAREHLQLMYAYRAAGDGEHALKEVQAASDLSPKKESIWLEVGSLEWSLGNAKGAQAAFNTAYELGHQFPSLAVYAAAGDIVAGDRAAADKILLDAYGTTTIDSDILAAAYYRAKDWPSLIKLWSLRAHADGASMQTWVSLAAAYYVSGDATQAIKTINDAVVLHPEAASSAAAIIAQIKGSSVGK